MQGHTASITRYVQWAALPDGISSPISQRYPQAYVVTELLSQLEWPGGYAEKPPLPNR